MRFTLLPFQQQTVERALSEVRLSMAEVASAPSTASGQAITLAAPTGAGKTVMAAAVLESLFYGDELTVGEDELTVVWLSDLPNVNVQTQRKIAKASDRIKDDRLVQVDTNFKAASLAAGHVYFLNTQKLSATSTLVLDSEDRTHTIWEILNRTIERNPSRFLLIIDEAHRGMERASSSDKAVANSIVQRFILGSPAMRRSPIILGISATPRRFDDLVAGANRTIRRAETDIAEVRSSGLIKERIVVWRPEHGLGHSEATLLQRAAQSLLDYQIRWGRYSITAGISDVAPIMVVQVEDKTGESITATDIEHAIETIEEVTGVLHPDSFAHCFGDAPAPIIAGLRRVRYIKPSDVHDDPQVAVVFFKTSLSTGWDCPRAEVIMSFRSAKDADSIAQLVGRMVRTPLARRVDSDEVLNTVALYLPKYDRGAVQSIIKQLRAGDPDFLPALEAEEGDGVMACERIEELYSVVESAARAVRSFVVPRARRMPPVARLERLAGSLSDFDVREDAPVAMDAQLVDILWARLAARRGTEQFDRAVEQAKKIGLNATTLSYLTGLTETETVQVISTSRSIGRLYEQVGARLGAGLHEKLWRRILQDDPEMTGDEARLLVIATLSEASTISAAEGAAKDQFDAWMSTHQDAIDELPEAERQDFDRLREHADDPSDRALSLPLTIRARRTDRSIDWPSSLYQDAEGLFPDTLNKWERDVLEEAIATSGLVCWVRNHDRQSWAFTVPYRNDGGGWSAMYPDFLFFRRHEGAVVVDVIDPHGLHLPDAPAKARGMADYANRFGGKFGRFEMVIYDKKADRRKTLDLKSSQVRGQVQAVTTAQHLAALFDLAGS